MRDQPRRKAQILLLAATGIVVILTAGILLNNKMRQPRSNPVDRGWRIAERMGCFGCHGAAGAGGVPNPGSDEGEVPAWDGGMLLMYVESEEEIREWIQDGHPERFVHEHNNCQMELVGNGLPISMPAYGSLLSDQELEDLVLSSKRLDLTKPLRCHLRRGRDLKPLRRWAVSAAIV